MAVTVRRAALWLFYSLWIHSPVHVAAARGILVVGSANADTFLSVDRLPSEGENVVCLEDPVVNVPGGKGCTQAVAAAKLVESAEQQPAIVYFLGQFGNDDAASILQDALTKAGVDSSFSSRHDDSPSGRGYVFLTRTGQVTAVVSGGSNLHGWAAWKEAWDQMSESESASPSHSNHPVIQQLASVLKNCKHVLLQREVPEYVNQLVATVAQQHNVCVLQDIGGQERPIDMMHLCDYIIPNETELLRLCQSFGHENSNLDIAGDGTVVELARLLQKHGARNVLVTRGSRGSTLVAQDGAVLHQPALLVDNVVDETGAGDCFRAAFCVALSEGKSLDECLQLASAAGACSVESHGAVPSTPTRIQVLDKWRAHAMAEETVLNIPRGDGLAARGGSQDDDVFPFMIGSRLNSMKDRPELWKGPLVSVKDWVTRQATVRGLTCVDFNYPQHFISWTKEDAKAALDETRLKAGAVCLRFPSKFARGAMNHPEPALREEATRLVMEAAETATFLGCTEVVVWSGKRHMLRNLLIILNDLYISLLSTAFDGYDYPFQVNYDDKWSELVSAFQQCCDAFPNIKFSVEYKPTDENTRFFTIPSTGAAVVMMQEVDRKNFGLTLDVGHMLMSGENPAQSIAMVTRAGKGKLFGIQLNDGYTRLAAEDGLMFGSIHPSMALEIMYQLRRINFDGHVYFDTFPQRTDPVKEAEYNIRRVKALWKAACSIDSKRLATITQEHDAVGALELVDEALGWR